MGVSLAKVCRSLMLLLTYLRMFFTWELRFWLAAYAHRTPILRRGPTQWPLCLHWPCGDGPTAPLGGSVHLHIYSNSQLPVSWAPVEPSHSSSSYHTINPTLLFMLFHHLCIIGTLEGWTHTSFVGYFWMITEGFSEGEFGNSNTGVSILSSGALSV